MVLKEYIKTDWENTPSTNTPLSKRNLDHLEQGVYENREALIDVTDQVANIDVQTIKESTAQAGEYAKFAEQSAENAQTSEQAAQNEAERAETAAQSVEDMARESESYAHGGTGTRVGEDTDNAKHYADLAARIVAVATTGALIPMGTIPFAQLPTEVVKPGWMYNISDDFESDNRFDIPSVHYPKGSNVYYTAKNKWDVLAGISPTVESLGAVKKTGDTMTGLLKVRMGKVGGEIESGGLEVGDRVIITSNSEGGNICIISPDGTKYEFDAYNGNLRLILGKIGPPQTTTTPFAIEKITGITSFIGVKLSGQKENSVPYLNASKQLVSSAVTPQELDYLGGVKSKIQQQIDDITKDLGGVSFGITDDGRPGYKKDGADTVYPFNSIVDIFIFDGTRQNVENTIDLEAGAYKLYEFGAEGRSSGSHMYIISPSFTVNSGAAEFLEIEKEKGEYSIDVSQKANVTLKWATYGSSSSEKIHVLSVITYNA